MPWPRQVLVEGEMVKHFAILILFFCAMPTYTFAQCCSCDQTDDCNVGEEATGNPNYPCDPFMCIGYDCSHCDETGGNCAPGEYLTTNGNCVACPGKYPFSNGGANGINKCSAQKQCSGVLCILYYDGIQDCDGAYLEYDSTGTLQCKTGLKNCSDFNFASGFNTGVTNPVNMTWQKNDQKETASWSQSLGKLNVDRCRLQKDGIVISNSINCTGTVWRMGATAVWNADAGHYDIKYTGIDWYYCMHCDAARTPQMFNFDTAQMSYNCWRYESGGQYLACKCTDVEIGYYSEGCNWAYPLDSLNPSGTAMCHQQCPDTMTTLNSGADSIDKCVPNGQSNYHDSTGSFNLGFNADLCS